MSYTGEFSFEPKPTFKYLFKPQEDITAYEMAQLLPLLIEIWSNHDFPSAVTQKKIPFKFNEEIEKLPQRLKDNFKDLTST
jgi:hypothetical protein